ncbi:MAG: hypothetical protein M1816_002634 [Peltula sp. TS41687]|nr:MAG: hypothetical protein M1816_002634 [Peltula sp. TS41687]
MSVRKAHNSGRNHLRNVVDYYQQIGHEKAQSVIDSITNSYAAEGQASANPMLAQPPGPGQPMIPPPFGFPGKPWQYLVKTDGDNDLCALSGRPGAMPPPPFGMPGGPQGVGGLPPPPLGRGMPFPPFPPPGGMNGPPPPLPGGLPFPPPGGFPPNFQIPPGFPPLSGINQDSHSGGPPGFPGGPPPGMPGPPSFGPPPGSAGLPGPSGPPGAV